MISLLAATAYGVGDFFGAIATRRSHPILASFIGQIFYVLVALIGLVFFAGNWSEGAGFWGLVTGTCEAVGFLVFYYALNVGSVSLVAPLVSVIYATIPVLWGLASGEVLALPQLFGLGLGLLAVWALTKEPASDEQTSRRPIAYVLVLCLVGGAMWGFSTVALSYVPENSGMVPILVAGLTAFAMLAVAMLARRRTVWPQFTRAAITPSIWSGALFGIANLFIISALRVGSLTLVGLLTALYPLATVILSRIVFKEQITRLRWFGIALAILAAALMSLEN
ncbi:MAG: hypothetical protein RIS26_879 [Actinomycetota bacterium]